MQYTHTHTQKNRILVNLKENENLVICDNMHTKYMEGTVLSEINQPIR